MKTTIPLREVASARAGDKGNICNVCVWVYDPRHYQDVKASLTAERVKAAFPDQFRGAVERYDIDELHGLNFVMHDALEGGVNSSLCVDLHGKAVSFLLLSMPVDVVLLNDPQNKAS